MTDALLVLQKTVHERSIFAERSMNVSHEPYFPLSHGIARLDDHPIVSGIIAVIRKSLRRRNAPCAYGPHKTLYKQFVSWSTLALFKRIFSVLAEAAGKTGEPNRLMIAATHLKTHRNPASLLKYDHCAYILFSATTIELAP